MPVMVKFDSRKAFLRDGAWWSADTTLERELNESTTKWIRETGGPPISDGDPEETVAREMAGRLGGKILLHFKSSTGRSEARFLEHRQMTLNFTASLPLSNRRRGSR